MGGCSSDSLRYHRETQCDGGYCYTCLAIGGCNFGQVTKLPQTGGLQAQKSAKGLEKVLRPSGPNSLKKVSRRVPKSLEKPSSLDFLETFRTFREFGPGGSSSHGQILTLNSTLMGSLAKGFLQKVCGNSAESSRKFAENTFCCLRKGCGNSAESCGNFAESCGKFSAMTLPERPHK